MEKNNEQLRKAFEAWHKKEYPNNSLEHVSFSGGYYRDELVFSRFEGWQAALAAQAQQESQWISVEERLPEKFVDVLVHPRPTDYICEAAWLGDAWYWSDYELNFGVITNKCAVTHWMPIPPVPEGGG